jgi:hypothetical protein
VFPISLKQRTINALKNITLLVFNYALSSLVLPKQARQPTPQCSQPCTINSVILSTYHVSELLVLLHWQSKLQIKSYNDGFALFAANGCHHSTVTPPSPCFLQHTHTPVTVGGEPSSGAVSKEKSSGPSEKTAGLLRAISGTMTEEATEGQDIWITKTSVVHTSHQTWLWISNYGFRRNVTAAFKSVSPVCCYNPANTCQNAGQWAQEVSGQSLSNPVHVTNGGWWEMTVTSTITLTCLLYKSSITNIRIIMNFLITLIHYNIIFHCYMIHTTIHSKPYLA